MRQRSGRAGQELTVLPVFFGSFAGGQLCPRPRHLLWQNDVVFLKSG